jgi:hypothetical protein
VRERRRRGRRRRRRIHQSKKDTEQLFALFRVAPIPWTSEVKDCALQ